MGSTPVPAKQSKAATSALDPMSLLDDLGSLSMPSGTGLTPTMGAMPMAMGGLQRTPSGSASLAPLSQLASSQASQPLLHYANAGGLDIEYTFVREPSIYQVPTAKHAAAPE